MMNDPHLRGQGNGGKQKAGEKAIEAVEKERADRKARRTQGGDQKDVDGRSELRLIRE